MGSGRPEASASNTDSRDSSFTLFDASSPGGPAPWLIPSAWSQVRVRSGLGSGFRVQGLAGTLRH
jgi:hypothetical protein